MNTSEKIVFPYENIGEWTIFRPFTAPGLFIYRHSQANDLLHFPDFGDGDLNSEQRREALDRYIVHKRPLTAIVIFLNVVALEDFIRDFGDRISNINNLENYFPNISNLRLTLKKPNSNKPSKQLDKDPTPLMDFEKLCELYLSCIGIEPISRTDFPRLYDLTIIRHSVAHNGSIIREIDLPRFQYYIVKANVIINPPVEFVRETCNFLYKTGRQFEEKIREKLFTEVINKLDQGWINSRPKILIDLIELFNFFGKLPPPSNPVPMTDNDRKKEGDKNYEILISECFVELETKFKVDK